MPERGAEAPHVRIVGGAADADLDDAVGVEQALVDRAAERRAVVEARAEVVVAGVAMGVDVDHADGPLRADRAQDRQADRMVAADRQRHDLGRDDGGVEGGDLGERAFQGVGLLDPAVAEVAHAGGVERGDAVRVQPAQQRGLVAHGARSVAGAGAVGHAAVVGHADDADIGVGEQLGEGRAEERGDARVARARLRVGHLLVAGGALDRVHQLLHLPQGRPRQSPHPPDQMQGPVGQGGSSRHAGRRPGMHVCAPGQHCETCPV